MTSQQIGQWLAFDAIEPIGRDWERTRLATTYAIGTKKPLEEQHFRPEAALAEDEDAE